MFALCETRLRSFTICKQACIVLAGTSFATTKALAFQRSAELCEANQKRSFLKTEGFYSRNRYYCHTMKRTPSEIFSRKNLSSPFKRDSFSSYFFYMLSSQIIYLMTILFFIILVVKAFLCNRSGEHLLAYANGYLGSQLRIVGINQRHADTLACGY